VRCANNQRGATGPEVKMAGAPGTGEYVPLSRVGEKGCSSVWLLCVRRSADRGIRAMVRRVDGRV
jgi:hypothetical protein